MVVDRTMVGIIMELLVKWRGHRSIEKQISKLCLRGTQTCALSLFCDLDINPLTLKLEGDLDILKMYPHTENEAASLRHSEQLRA